MAHMGGVGVFCGRASNRVLSMQSVVIAIHLMIVLALIGVVLLQKSEGGGLVSSTSGFLSNRGTANALTRATAFLAAGFFATSLILSLLAGHGRESIALPASNGAPAQGPSAPLPTAPLSSGGNGILNQLGGNNAPANTPSAPAPSAPAPSAPSGPQVPQSQ
jgi:preprotein translocase subunit SecG